MAVHVRPRGNPVQARWRPEAGLIATATVIVALSLASRTALRVPNPPALLVLCVVFAAFTGGMVRGLVAAVLSWTYIASFFSLPARTFTYSPENLRRVAIWALTLPVTAVLVGMLKRRADRFRAAAHAERFRAVVDAISDVILLLDDSAIVRYGNRSAERTFGLEPDELRGKRLLELLHPDDRPAAERAVADTRSQPDEPVACELRGRRPDGTHRILRGLMVNQLEEQSIGAVVCSFRDETERRQAEEAARASAEDFRAFFERQPLPMWVYDQESLRFLAVNDAAVAHYGYTREEFLSMTVESIRSVEDAARAPDRPTNPAGAMATRGIYRHRKKDGTIIEAEVHAAPVQLEGWPALLVVAKDVSEQKTLERQLRQAQKMEAIGQLAGGIAHDFNNILSVILGYTSMLLRAPGHDEPARRKLGEINRAAERAAGLTRQLLAFSRREMVRPQVFSLDTVVVDLASMLRRLIGEDIALTTTLVPACTIRADRGQVEQVIVNLVVNARDAMPVGGTLTIEVASAEVDEAKARAHVGLRTGSYVQLTVTDTGAGMDADTQARVFEPFFTTKAAGHGTGLGLSMVYGIVKQADGYIAVRSQPGRGTSFEVYFPHHRPEPEQCEAKPASEAVRAGSAAILVVEDEVEVRRLACEVLEADGYQVIEAESGEDAVGVLSTRGPVDLVVTDVVMRGMNGRELAERLSRSWPNLKILFMSGYTDDAVVRRGVVTDSVAFVQKPFTAEGLIDKVREVLRD
jgi:two-component system, cell cycle sensor histidine kinase and response regulator CckA